VHPTVLLNQRRIVYEIQQEAHLTAHGQLISECPALGMCGALLSCAK
jgi:hypothetical protein